jgi:hypothetical protein
VDANPDMPATGVPIALQWRFTAAEGALYPLAITDPERYERAVTLVGLVFRQLRDECASIDDLVSRLPGAEDVTRLAVAQGITLAGLDPAAIADAAAALRYRELQSGPLTG